MIANNFFALVVHSVETGVMADPVLDTPTDGTFAGNFLAGLSGTSVGSAAAVGAETAETVRTFAADTAAVAAS